MRACEARKVKHVRSEDSGPPPSFLSIVMYEADSCLPSLLQGLRSIHIGLTICLLAGYDTIVLAEDDAPPR